MRAIVSTDGRPAEGEVDAVAEDFVCEWGVLDGDVVDRLVQRVLHRAVEQGS